MNAYIHSDKGVVEVKDVDADSSKVQLSGDVERILERGQTGIVLAVVKLTDRTYVTFGKEVPRGTAKYPIIGMG